jgi:hypothetical protein
MIVATLIGLCSGVLLGLLLRKEYRSFIEGPINDDGLCKVVGSVILAITTLFGFFIWVNIGFTPIIYQTHETAYILASLAALLYFVGRRLITFVLCLPGIFRRLLVATLRTVGAFSIGSADRIENFRLSSLQLSGDTAKRFNLPISIEINVRTRSDEVHAKPSGAMCDNDSQCESGWCRDSIIATGEDGYTCA